MGIINVIKLNLIRLIILINKQSLNISSQMNILTIPNVLYFLLRIIPRLISDSAKILWKKYI